MTPNAGNLTSSIGVHLTGQSTDNSYDEMKIEGYYVGFQDDGYNNHVSGTVHCWTGQNAGYMASGFVVNGGNNYYGRVYIDTPWTPANTDTVGVLLNGPCTIGEVSSTINGAVGTLDNTAILIRNTYAGTTGKSVINNVHCTSFGVKWKSVVDNTVYWKTNVTTASLANLVIDNIQTDGNVYSVGYTTALAAAVNQVGVYNTRITTLESTVLSLQATATGQPWSPQKIPTEVLGWFDANFVANITQADGYVSAWAFRIGIGVASQGNGAQQPLWSAIGFNGVKPAITFDGLTQMLSSGASFFTNQQNFRIFTVFQNEQPSTATAGALIDIGNQSVTSSSGDGFNARLRFNSQTDMIFGHIGSGTAGFTGVPVGPSLASMSLGAAAANSSGSALTTSARLNGSRTTGSVNGLALTNGIFSAPSGVTQNIIAPANWATFGGQNISLAGGYNVKAALAEVVILTGALGSNDAEDRLVEGYLAWKWGINSMLPTNHPYYYAQPLNS